MKKGQVLADGPARERRTRSRSERALRVHAWNGYNFEDAILISRTIVKDDIFTSIHIDEFEVVAATRSSGRKKSRATSRTSVRKR